MRKNTPGDTGQFVGQSNREHVAVQHRVGMPLAEPQQPAGQNRGMFVGTRCGRFC